MKWGQAVFLVLLAFVISAGTIFSLYGDWLWYNAVGYQAIFSTIIVNSIILGALAMAGFFIFTMLNVFIAKRRSLKKKSRGKTRGIDTGLTIAILFISLGIGLAFSNWEVVWRYLNQVPFGVADPLFSLDVSFYVFTLPLWGYLFSYAAVTLLAGILFSLVAYFAYSGPRKTRAESEEEFVPAYSIDLSAIKDRFTPHLSVLLGIVFILAYFGFTIAQYNLLFSGGGVVYGAGYTDVNVNLYILMLMSWISVALGIFCIANLKIKRWRVPFEGIAAIIAVGVIGLIIAGVVQALMVSPDEFNLEKPYIERNIEATLDAYGIGSFDERIFPLSYDLTQQDLEDNAGTIDNIRLWDWRPLTKTYNQLQLFRTYYDFNDVDIDRYTLNGDYSQVMVSAREMDIMDLQSNARTWVNEHLVYTHGYGIVMNPVNMVTPEGLPDFYVQDIPPESEFDSTEVENPAIYYGEDTFSYAITGTTTNELDYPSGNENVYTTYGGTGGVTLGDLLSRFTFAVKETSPEILFSASIQPESKILLYREIAERVRKLAPFLRYDADPYVVVSEGRLFWIVDAYTITDSYPYSEPVYSGNQRSVFNYIRNSVKVLIDAYNGDVTFYVIDQNDPVIRTYMNIFPGIFQSFEDMPDDLKLHIRYPEDLFSVQAELYATYHMKDPRVFYNREDVWVVPDEVYRAGRQQITPYYIIVKLPGEDSEQFVIMLPFSPRGKENLIGWMAAKSDMPDYGEIVVYAFSKQELAYGPMQIEARIDQDTDISQLFTLWGQVGSDVIRGNTLVIPIMDSILYIEPVYLEATETGTLPQLKRVIVAYENRVVMRETLQDALAEIFGSAPSVPSEPGEPGGTSEETLQQVAELYQKAQEALAAGNLGLYQLYVDQIGSLLENY
jgi:uncharacterized membrane protein (UPF0182 family)